MVSLSDSPNISQSPIASQGGNPLPILADDVLGFQFRDASRSAAESEVLLDPVETLMPRVRACGGLAELREIIHPLDLFHEFRDRRTTYATILRWLEEIVTDGRSHTEVGEDSTFAVRLLAPVPFCQAIITKSRKEGWLPESLLQQLLVNGGWLEHHGARLVLKPTDEHTRATAIAAFNAQHPSQGKSSLCKFVGHTCMQNPYNEVHIRDGICCSAEATPKGIRAAFRSYSRGGLESDEVTTAYECGLSGRGLHPANLQKMLTWVNCERDSVITGQQAEHYDDYSFLHRVHGQLRPIETTLIAGRDICFPKRFHFVWLCSLSSSELSQHVCGASTQLLTSWHT